MRTFDDRFEDDEVGLDGGADKGEPLSHFLFPSLFCFTLFANVVATSTFFLLG